MIEVIGKQHDFCPDNCKYLDLDVESTDFFADSILHHTQNDVYCRRRDLCEYLHCHITGDVAK